MTMAQVILQVSIVISVLVPIVLGCCGPQKWEGYESISSGVVVNGVPYEISGMVNVSLDGSIQKMVQRGTFYYNRHPVKQVILDDFATGKRYDVKGGSCSIESGKPLPMPANCMPDDARKLLSTYFGSEDAKFEIDVYQYTLNGVEVTETVTKDSCVTVGQKFNVENGLFNLAFFGLTEGIRDMSVFAVPKECEGQDV